MGGEEAPPTEQERVESWRFDALVRAGYPTGAAAALAAKPDVDLHRAVAMLEHGCDTLVALDILL